MESCSDCDESVQDHLPPTSGGISLVSTPVEGNNITAAQRMHTYILLHTTAPLPHRRHTGLPVHVTRHGVTALSRGVLAALLLLPPAGRLHPSIHPCMWWRHGIIYYYVYHEGMVHCTMTHAYKIIVQGVLWARADH